HARERDVTDEPPAGRRGETPRRPHRDDGGPRDTEHSREGKPHTQRKEPGTAAKDRLLGPAPVDDPRPLGVRQSGAPDPEQRERPAEAPERDEAGSPLAPPDGRHQDDEGANQRTHRVYGGRAREKQAGAECRARPLGRRGSSDDGGGVKREGEPEHGRIAAPGEHGPRRLSGEQRGGGQGGGG